MTITELTRFRFSRKLIEESGLAECLHIIFQNQHIPPGIVMGVRTANDPVTSGERAFMLASTQKAAEEGDTPVKIRSFSGKKKENNN